MVNRRAMRPDYVGVNYRPCPNNSQCDPTHGSNASSCTSGGDCRALLKKLQRIDFAIVDTILYLDAYPECKKAKAYYDKLIAERASLRDDLAKKCKRPVTPFENASDDWDWISSPWPWEESAN